MGKGDVSVAHDEDTKFYVLYLEVIELLSEDAKTSGLECGIHW